MAPANLDVRRATAPFAVNLPVPGHRIGGRVVAGSGQPAYTVMDPARGTPLLEVPLGEAATVDRAVQAARAAAPGWAGLTPRTRAEMLLRLATAIEDDTDTLRALEALNCGKPAAVTEDDVSSAVDTFRFMAGAGRAAQSPAAGDYVDDTTSLILREPLGVIGMITPWNYPLLMAAWKVAPALMAGNTVLLKPSEITPLTTLRLADIAADILPAGVLNVVIGDGPVVGEAISAHPQIDMIALTGSVRAGTAVARTAAATLKRVHLELGGKAPVIVCPDADLAQAVAAVTEAGLWNSGQECGAACRVLAHSSVAAEFAAALADRVSGIVLAEPEIDEPDALGPMISQAQYARVREHLADAVADGAEVLTGGEGEDSCGYWVQPTVLRVPATARITRTEVFGPVISVESYEQEAEAVERANDVEYGLAASVFTRDLATALSISKRLDFGSVNANTHLALPTEMPWGGFKRSGYGRDLSAYALDDYSRTKHLALSHVRD